MRDRAVVRNVWIGRVIGGRVPTHLRSELVLTALDMTLQQCLRQRHHRSDHGCQYAAAGVRPSMWSVGDCYDVMCEGLFCDARMRVPRSGHVARDARLALFDFVEGWTCGGGTRG